METQIIKINDIVIDEELYPRIHWDFVTKAKYYNALRSGNAKFPPIAVALFEGK
jgi:hypothetical protein